MNTKPDGPPSASRRQTLLAGSALFAAADLFKKAHGMEPAQPAPKAHPYAFKNDPDHENLARVEAVHAGKGTIDIKLFFRDDGAPRPALLLTYNIPPGASEGVHTHNVGDKKMGSFDEFYYILSGTGVMEIAGEKLPVAAGDHIFTPNGVAHGIENTATQGDLRVYLVAMIRD